jgi:hypothetical protein
LPSLRIKRKEIKLRTAKIRICRGTLLPKTGIKESREVMIAPIPREIKKNAGSKISMMINPIP